MITRRGLLATLAGVVAAGGRKVFAAAPPKPEIQMVSTGNLYIQGRFTVIDGYGKEHTNVPCILTTGSVHNIPLLSLIGADLVMIREADRWKVVKNRFGPVDNVKLRMKFDFDQARGLFKTSLFRGLKPYPVI